MVRGKTTLGWGMIVLPSVPRGKKSALFHNHNEPCSTMLGVWDYLEVDLFSPIVFYSNIMEAHMNDEFNKATENNSWIESLFLVEKKYK